MTGTSHDTHIPNFEDIVKSHQSSTNPKINNSQSEVFNDFLIGKFEMKKLFNCSDSTLNRMINDGRVSKPDVAGGNGAGNKWLKSTAMEDLKRLCGMKEAS